MGRTEIRIALLCFAIAVISGRAVAQTNGDPGTGHNNKELPATADTRSDPPQADGPVPKKDDIKTKEGTKKDDTTTAPQGTLTEKSTAHKGGGGPTAHSESARVRDEQTRESEPGWRSMLSSRFGARNLPGLLLSGLVGLALGVMAGGLIVRRNTKVTGASNKDAEREIGEALKKPGIALAAVPEEIRDLERRFVKVDGDHCAQIKELEGLNADLRVQLSGLQRSPEQIRLQAAMMCINDARQALASAPTDPDFYTLDQTFELRAALEDTLQHLAALPTGDGFIPALLDALERGRLDHVLTMPSFLDTYFLDRPRWAALHLAYSSTERLLTGLLQSNGVQLVRKPLLSIVSTAEARGADVGDRRNVKKIPAVRQTAARVARDLDPGELLVVDCHAPGWESSHKIGSKVPGFALFEPSTWT